MSLKSGNCGDPSAAIDDDRSRYVAAELFGPRREIEIALGDAIYRLRWTKSDKLILTK